MKGSQGEVRWTAAILAALRLALPVSLAGAQAAVDQAKRVVSDLPLVWVAPRGPSLGVTAVLLSGDGGWAHLISSVADGLAARGIAVVGINSRAWLATPRTPDETAAAVVRAVSAARTAWPASRLLLVGYSRGADLAPFVATRLPAELSSGLAGIAMFGLAPTASFEFHLMDLVRTTRRSSDLAVLPELEKLRGVRMVCVYGSKERSSACRDAPEGLMRTNERPGGHHFDNDTEALVSLALALLEPG